MEQSPTEAVPSPDPVGGRNRRACCRLGQKAIRRKSRGGHKRRLRSCSRSAGGLAETFVLVSC
jgi:hypothetical protein